MSAPRRRLLLVLASCAFLAWSLQRLLVPFPVISSSADDYIVTAPAQPVRNPASEGDDAWLLTAVVDGRVVSLTELERTGSWKDVGFALVHRRDGTPATIRVRGSRVTLSFLTSKYSGIVRVDGARGGMDLDLYHPDRPEADSTFVAVDLADGRVAAAGRTGELDYVTTIAALAILLTVATFTRAWGSRTAFDRWIVGHVVVLHALVWLTQGVGYNADGRGYAEGFAEFVAGKASYYPPGYPLLLGLLGGLFPTAIGLAVTATQHVLMVLALWGLARVARECLGDELAALGLLVAGSASPTLFLPQVVFSENPAFVGMAGALWFVSRRCGSRQTQAHVPIAESAPERSFLDIAAGILVGWAALARVSPLLAVLLPVFLLQLHAVRVWPLAITRTARVLLTAILVVAATGTWIYHGTKRFEIANSSGLHLYSRVVTEQFLIDRDAPATRSFLSIVGDRPLKDVGHWEISSVVMGRGLDYTRTVALMGDVAIEGALSQPFALLGYSLRMAWREYAASPMPDVPRWASGSVPAPQFENLPLLGIRASSLLWRDDLDRTFALLWPALLWMPLAGIAFLPWLRGRLVFLSLLAVPAGYLFAASFADIFVNRYMICVVPFALLLTPAPLAGLAGLWRGSGQEA